MPDIDPLLCTLGDACEQWGELVEEPSAEGFPCEPLSWGLVEATWYAALGPIPCPFGTCEALDVQLALERSGSIAAMFMVELPTPRNGGGEGGYWFKRQSSDGRELGSYLWDYAIPPPGVKVQRNAQLLNDASGDAVLASSRVVLPSDAPRPLAIQKLRKPNVPELETPSVQTPGSYPVRTAIGPKGELLVLSTYGSGALDAARSVLTLHDRRGRVLWNRPWREGENIQTMHVDSAGHITVEYRTGGAEPDDPASIARLDMGGRVIWRRAISEPDFEAQTAVDRQGNVYVLVSRWTLITVTTHLERIDTFGRRSAVWNLDQVDVFPQLHRGRDGVYVLARTQLSGVPELWLLAFDSKSDASGCAGWRYAWTGELSSLFGESFAIAQNDQSELYIANMSGIFKFAGGAP